MRRGKGGRVMELSVNGRQRRAAQAAGTAPQAERKSPAAGKAALPKARTDRTAWSQAALSFLQEADRQDMEKRRKLLEAKQQSKGELDALSESLKKMERCRKIASRIMRGDKVPPQDEMYLMDNDPDGYKLALACRTPKEKPKEWESVLKDEDEKNSGSGEAEDSGEAAPADTGGEAAEC